MNAFTSKLSPSITSMIRLEHSHVLAKFHKYDANASASNRQALVDMVCLALEIHTQLEEEIFYPNLVFRNHYEYDICMG